ncbi:YdcF family protein [Streptomyces otsuchiensis]|uniref:YdcF family protein n=1 Tax=Streptomyces otsuchiensis TaxID=2681388 RepID=UPI0010304B2F|nr:YdcF family protein [Streptomyces otsuchiensis]
MTDDAIYQDAETLWDYLRMNHPRQRADVAIGLGSHDLGVADVAADLYLAGLTPLLLFTGGNSPTTRERMPRGEAVHYRERAIELGVPASSILVEPHASNTGENISLSRTTLAEAGVRPSRVALVSKPYEERRAFATAAHLWPSAQFTCASQPVTLAQYIEQVADVKFIIDMVVGTYERVVRYPAMRFTAEQPFNAEAHEAFRRLVEAGYTSRLLT